MTDARRLWLKHVQIMEQLAARLTDPDAKQRALDAAARARRRLAAALEPEEHALD